MEITIENLEVLLLIAALKEAGVHGRLRLLVEAESLFNDATAAIGFGVVLAFVSGEAISIQTALLNGAWSIFDLVVY